MRYRVKHLTNIPEYFYQDSYVRQDRDILTGVWSSQKPHIGGIDTTSYRYDLSDNLSRMWDDVDPLPAKKKKKDFFHSIDREVTHPARSAKACLHLQYRLSIAKRVTLSYTTYAGSNTRYNHSITMSTPSFYGHVMNLIPGSDLTSSLASTTVNQRTNGGIPDEVALLDGFDNKLKNFFSNHVDLGENIAEPDVFVEAVKLIISPRTFLKEFVHTITHRYGNTLHKKNLGEVFSHIAKDISGGYLTWVFGYKPVIRDLKAAFGAHRDIERRLAYLRTQQGNFIKVHSRQLLNSGVPYVPTSTTGTLGTTAVMREDNGILTVSCDARVRTDLDQVNTFAAYAEYFGVNDVIGLTWDLIPFSFVVDWITNFGTWWHQATRINFGGPFSETKNLCYTSNKFDALDIHVKSGSSSFYGAYVSCADRLARIAWKRYDRSLTVPDEVLRANLSRWSGFQTVTSGALLTQRIPDGLRLLKPR